jgi:hypothetical protein
MKSHYKYFPAQAAVLALLASVTHFCAVTHAGAAPNLALWDTVAPLSDAFSLADQTGWKAVPTDLLLLEANPPKARSDPGYYGREYTFKGDAIVENKNLAAVFWQSKGRMVIYAKDSGRKLLETCPVEATTKAATITRFSVLRNTGDELALEAVFSAPGGPEVSEVFVFDRTGVVEIKPARNAQGITLAGPLAYGIVPSFIGDDLIYNAADYPSAKELNIPAENFFLGLLPGEQHELMLSWPKGKQQMTLRLAGEQSGERLIDSVDFANDGQSLYLQFLDAPGIWHKENLTPAYLEKDRIIAWKKPFPARWKTQLDENDVKTSYTFRETKEEIWRGVAGSYAYPVWFDGDNATYHLGKKVPPKGESLIYFLEPQDTPLSVSTPADFLKATLGRPIADSILDLEGRKLSTHHRRGGEGVRRACTCGCTEAIQAVFEAHQEKSRKEDIAGDVDDMIYFIHRHVERIDHYQAFANEMIQFLEAKAAAMPELKPYLENLEEIARKVPQEYSVQKENMKSFAHADDLARQTLELAVKTDPNNLPAYMKLLDAWRDMGGAQDYVLAQCHTLTRKLCEEAGYTCVNQSAAAGLAEEIRSRCRECLRNPDGYEIWADY